MRSFRERSQSSQLSKERETFLLLYLLMVEGSRFWIRSHLVSIPTSDSYIEIECLLSNSTSVWAAAEKVASNLSLVFAWNTYLYGKVHPLMNFLPVQLRIWKRKERQEVLILKNKLLFGCLSDVLMLTSAFIFEVWEVHHLLWENKET